MSEPDDLQRSLAARLPLPGGARRLVVLTGARQVGKTTLARALYGAQLRYLNFDSPGERARLNGVPSEGWARLVGPAVLDEVQKLPSALEKIKWAYDEGGDRFLRPARLLAHPAARAGARKSRRAGVSLRALAAHGG